MGDRSPENWKVVLIDDEEGIRKVTGITLEDSGYEVRSAPNGKEGLALCEKFAPQIVITDIRMPEMDGIAVLEELKNRKPEVQVIVATAFGEMDLAIRALQLDASDFITKPINDEALHLAMERAKGRFVARKKIRDYTILLEKGWNETTRELMETFFFQNNLIESSMDGILGCNAKEKVVIFNKSMERMLGYTKSEALSGMVLGDFFLPEMEIKLKKALSENKFGGENALFMYETSLKGKSGQGIPVQASSSRIMSRRTENGVVYFFRDLRDIRRLEREMEDQAKILHQDKMISLGRLASSVVHEINNPLAGVLNYCRLMSRVIGRGSLSQEHVKKFGDYLSLVTSETERCSRIVSSLLTFSRKSPANFSQVDVDDLLQKCILLSHHKLELNNIYISYEQNGELPKITGDYNQLQQCVINLIFNAMDAISGGGTISIRTEVDKDKNQVSVIVKDDGAGISRENLPHIFEPFFTTKEEGYGVGLGLSTLYGIIRRHNATITVDSQKGEGAEFVMQFPFESSL